MAERTAVPGNVERLEAAANAVERVPLMDRVN